MDNNSDHPSTSRKVIRKHDSRIDVYQRESISKINRCDFVNSNGSQIIAGAVNTQSIQVDKMVYKPQRYRKTKLIVPKNIAEFLKRANRSERKCPVEIPYRYGLPDPVVNFCGREDELERIHLSLQTVSSQVVAISGLGGIGKTETAKTYAKLYEKDYDIILYVIGDNRKSLLDTFYKIANDFQIEMHYRLSEKVKRIKNVENVMDDLYRCCSSCGKTLLILDNVDEPTDILTFLPRRAHDRNRPKVLITSRKQNWSLGDYGSIETIILDIFTFEVATEFIKKLLNESCYTEDDMKKLCDRLQSLPLGIKQAVEFIRTGNTDLDFGLKYTVADYLNDFENHAVHLLQYQNDKTDMYFYSVMNTWKVTIDKIKSNYGDDGELAVKVLEYISYMPADDISSSLIFKTDDDRRYMRAISLLKEYSMINFNRNVISIHRLVQKVIRTDIKLNNREVVVLCEIIDLLHELSKTDGIDPYISTVWEVAIEYKRIIKKYYKNLEYSPLMVYLEQSNACDLNKLNYMLECEHKYGSDSIIIDSIKLSIARRKSDAFQFIYKFLEEHSFGFDVNELVLKAAFEGNIEILEFLLQKGGVINAVDRDGRTSLITACIEGQVDMVKKLLEYETCDVNIQAEGWTALMCASYFERIGIVRVLLLNDRCDLNLQNGDGRTALIIACLKRCVPIAKMLIESDRCDLNLCEMNGWTALMIACTGEIDIIRMLMGKDECDLNVRMEGWTALMLAVLEGNMDVVKVLVDDDRCDVNLQNMNGRTALIIAFEEGRFDMMGTFVECGKFDLDVQTKGWSVLTFACHDGNAEAVRMLIDSNRCDLNAQNADGRTPLMIACQEGHVEVVGALVKSDRCDLNMQEAKGHTAAMIACQNGHFDIVKMLMEDSRCDLSLRNEAGEDVLLIACQESNTDMVKMLIATGVFDVNLKNKQQWTALMIAANNGNVDVVKTFLGTEKCDLNSRTEYGCTALMFACISGFVEVVKVLLEDDECDVNLREDEGWSALMVACQENGVEVVQALVNNDKCDLNIQSNLGLTALMLACSMGIVDCVRILSETLKCDLNLQNEDGETALIIACREGNIEVVRILVEKERCDLNVKMSNGGTALTVAYKKGNMNIVKMLLENDRCDLNMQDTKGLMTLVNGSLMMVRYMMKLSPFRKKK